MSDYLYSLIDKYKGLGILIDTNIILLLFVGSFSLQLLKTFKNTQIFVEEDYHRLTLFLEPFKRQVTTPNIMTEVYNLSNQLPNHIKPHFFLKFREIVLTLDETYTPSQEITKTIEFLDLGLTDAGIYLTAKEKYLVLTDDFRLSQSLDDAGIDTLNFNHLRTYL